MKIQTQLRLFLACLFLTPLLLAQEHPTELAQEPLPTGESERVAADSQSPPLAGASASARTVTNALLQPFPRESHHQFWDRKNILLHGGSAVAAAADFCTTRRTIARGGHELNPLARPFAGSNASFAVYKAGSWGTYLGLSYFFHRRGWHRLERILPLLSMSTDGAAIGFNLKRSF
jgi:hypothetical protein